MDRIILHIDFDSFFASVEQQYTPQLRNRPVGVTAANSRTAIIASSREAKKLGIKTGSASWRAYMLCPTLVLVPADFVKYWEVSKKFISICKDFSPYVEVFSIDELFMDITKTAHLFGDVEELIEKMKIRIKNEIGEFITVSIGISHNKLLAKLGSGMKKPNGIMKITQDNLHEVYIKAELTDICGIGSRIERRLIGMGITNLLRLKEAPLRALIAEFGNVEGHFLNDIGQGIDTRPIIPYSKVDEVKSIGRNYCLPYNQYSERVVLQNFYELCEELAIKLRRLHKGARATGFSWHGSIDVHFHKTFSNSLTTGKEIYEHCMALLPYSPFINEASYVRQIRVWVGNLEDSTTNQLSLFARRKPYKLWQTIDKINEKFGDHTIRNGFLLNSSKLTTVPNGYMADKYERSKLAANPLFE